MNPHLVLATLIAAPLCIASTTENLLCGQSSPAVQYSGPFPVADVGVGDTPNAAIYDVLKDLWGYRCVVECPPGEGCYKAAIVTGGRGNISNTAYQVGDVHFADIIVTGRIKGFITCSDCGSLAE